MAATHGGTGACPVPPADFDTWADYIKWLFERREESTVPIAVGNGTYLIIRVADGLLLRWISDGPDGGDGQVDSKFTPLLKNVRAVHTRDDFTVAVSIKGNVYTWGTCGAHGNHGQLGHGHFNPVSKPERVRALENHTITSVSAGMDHCLAVTEFGKVLGWGNNSVHQCSPRANASAVELHVPVRVGLPVDAVINHVSAGHNYSLVVTREGEVYSFGECPGSVAPHRPWEVQFPSNVRIQSAAAGGDHALALTRAGEVFAWGRNAFGQVGAETGGAPQTMPRRVVFNDPKVVTAHLMGVGTVAAAEHVSAAVTLAGELFVWGYLGGIFPGNANRLKPLHIKDGVMCISLDRENIIGITEEDEGTVFGWGKLRGTFAHDSEF